MSRVLLALVLLFASTLHAAAPVYVILWFDTEDYIDPAADDAALRIASDLTRLKVKATFKLVGEKARMLEKRGRTDVIRALSAHAIGYHSNFHSVHPTPSEYLRHFGYLEGADEFQRREGQGVLDIRRIFGVPPLCYGQPGSSWGPQSNLGLRKMGIPIYLDEGEQVGLDGQPFWYGGLLYVFNMGKNQFRARLDGGDEDREAYARFDKTAAELRAAGGGLISIYYHPTEFANLEFWDAVNFSKGANPPRSEWKPPRRRTKEDSERCYRVLQKFVEHMKSVAGTQFIGAGDLLRLYQRPIPPPMDRIAIAKHLSGGIDHLKSGESVLSPADMTLQLLGIEPQIVDGPVARGETSWRSGAIPRAAFENAKRDAADYIRRNKRLPSQVFLGAETLSLADFVATLAASDSSAGPVQLVHGDLKFERRFSADPVKSFNWVIHPTGFAAPELLELGKLQGWTLKPARLAASVKR